MVEVIRKKNASAYKRLEGFLKTLGSTELKVGWFETAKYDDGTPVAYVAVIHEFGSSKQNIPPRPFMRPTIAANEDKWRSFIKQEAGKLMNGQTTIDDMFGALGLNISGEIARAISEIQEPPLKPATIAARKRKLADKVTTGALDKPLVETNTLLKSVTYTVGKE